MGIVILFVVSLLKLVWMVCVDIGSIVVVKVELSVVFMKL